MLGLLAPARWSPIPNPLSGRRSIRYLPLRDVSHSIAQPTRAKAAATISREARSFTGGNARLYARSAGRRHAKHIHGRG